MVVVITASDVNDNPVLSGRPELTIEENEMGYLRSTSPEDRIFDGADPQP